MRKSKLTRGHKERIVYRWAIRVSADKLAALLVSSAKTTTLDNIITEENLLQ